MKRFGSMTMIVILAIGGTLAGCRGQEPPAADVSIKTDFGVTKEPCPQAVDATKGCIYLGVLSDLTGPVASLGVTAAEGVKAFWKRVNTAGGIGGKFEVDAS